MKKLVTLWKRPSYDGESFTYYLLYYENGKRKQKSLGHVDRRKAERQRAQFERELRMGVVEPSSMRLREFMKDSLARTGDQIRESTREDYESSMKDFIEVIGNIDYQKVTLEHGELYRQNRLDKGNSPATVAKKLRELKRLFKLAVNRRQLEESPLQYIAISKSPKKKVDIYADVQCRRMWNAAQEYTAKWNPERSVKWDLMITVALVTAMRRAELLNCTWVDVDFDAQTIEVNPKKNTRDTWEWLIKDADHRTLPLTEEIVQMLVDHQARQPEGYPYVFVPTARYDYIQNVLRPKGTWTLTDARLKVVNNLRRQFNRILAKAGIEKGTFHDIRRTAISLWFANGMSEHDVMVLAGHSSFATTHKFYLAVADDLVDRARQATSQVIGEICCKSVAGASEHKKASTVSAGSSCDTKSYD